MRAKIRRRLCRSWEGTGRLLASFTLALLSLFAFERWFYSYTYP